MDINATTVDPSQLSPTTLFVLDWLTVKPIMVELKNTDLTITSFKPGEQIIFSVSEEGKIKYMLGTIIGYPCECNKQGVFVRKPRDDEKVQFIASQTKVQKYFDIFKEHFKAQFPNAKPISARSDIGGTIVYFYFYCEDRLNFIEFLKVFRPLVPMNFFFYQVGARDMVRLHPQASEWLTECGCGPMGCCSNGALPTIDMENVVMQSLEGRDIEKLKGRCGKLKCSVVYERYWYLEETADYPRKGDTISCANHEGRCIGHNAIQGEIVGKASDGVVFRGPISQVKILEKAKGRETVAEQLGISEKEAKKLEQE